MKAKVTFFEKVDTRSRKAMIDFLCNHKRYNTMSSWNNGTSWANNLKIDRVIPNSLQDKVFEMRETSEFYEDINDLIFIYGVENSHCLQAGFNGRSGGYLVMYEGFRKESEHKSYCTSCGQRNFKTVEESGNKCGKCGEPSRINRKFFSIGTYPGKSIDSNDREDYEDKEQFSMSDLREITSKVQEFDKLCDDIVQSVIYTAENCEIVEEEYTVTKTRKVLSCSGD